MKRTVLAVLLCITALPALGRGQYFSYAQQGGASVSVAGFSSSTKVQKSFPGATVSVYVAGSSTLATLYSDSGGTAKANPFTANTSNSSFVFWTDTTTFDITFSGVGITTSCGSLYPGYPCISAFTWTNQTYNGSVGGTALFNVRSYGAIGDGVTNDTAAFVSTWTAAKAAKNASIYIPNGAYVVTDSLPIIYHSDVVSVIGEGFDAKIYFTPSVANKTCMAFEPSGYSTFDRLYVGNFAIFGNGAFAKTLLRVTASSNLSELFNLILEDTTNTTTTALRWEGWDQTSLRDSWIRAKNPLVIAKPSAGTLSSGNGAFDHISITDTTIWSDYSTSYLIEMSDGTSPNLAVSQLSIRGHGAWVGGKGGIHFTGANITGIHVDGVRWEGNAVTLPDGSGWFLDLEPSGSASINLTFTNVQEGLDHANDVKLRNVKNVSFTDCTLGYGGAWAATEVVLDFGATVDRVLMQNVNMVTPSNYSIDPALERRWATTTISANYNNYASVFWAQRSSSGSQYDLAYEQGVVRYRISIPSLANNGTYTLISTTTNSNDPTPGIILIAAEDVARSVGTSAMGIVFSRWDSVVIATDALGTMTTASGSANKLNVYRSGADIIIENKLGIAVKVTVLYN